MDARPDQEEMEEAINSWTNKKRNKKRRAQGSSQRVADAIKDGYRFEACVEDDGQRVIGGEANAGVSFQIGKIR